MQVASVTGSRQGVLVVMNWRDPCSQVCYQNSLTNVQHLSNSCSRASPGLVMKTRNPLLQNNPGHKFAWSWLHTGLVPIISAYAGMTDELIDMLDLNSWMAWVIQAFGAGNVPKKRLKVGKSPARIPSALVSRCFNGIAETQYHAYQGGGVELQRAGFLCPRTPTLHTPQIINCP